MSDQLVNQLAVLKEQTSALPDWMPSDWLNVKILHKFAAVADELSEFRDQWLTTESLFRKVNTIFKDNDIDIHLRLLAGPESLEASAAIKKSEHPLQRDSAKMIFNWKQTTEAMLSQHSY